MREASRTTMKTSNGIRRLWEGAWRMGCFALTLKGLLGAAGCVGLRQYHKERAEYLRTCEDPATGATADLCIIEFDDQGGFWDLRQLQDAVALIRQRNAESPNGIVTPVFIHGWKNNADWNMLDGNLRGIAGDLPESASLLQQQGGTHPSRVVGVYIGWRGEIARDPVTRALSFWNRLHAADRMASLHLKEALFSIIAATKERPESKIILYGHSMGGRILFKSIGESLINRSVHASGANHILPVDLVVMANPAISALEVARFVDLMKRHRLQLVVDGPDGEKIPAQGPLIASITSESDYATRRAFPFGQNVTRPFRAYRKDHPPGQPSQAYLAGHTDGHTDMLVSHRAEWVDGKVVLSEVPDRYNDTPYWVIRTTHDICRHHSDIDNPRMNELVRHLLELREAFKAGDRPQLLADPLRPAGNEPPPAGAQNGQ
jgi:hypothetical protein